jgi:hypothetical protein
LAATLTQTLAENRSSADINSAQARTTLDALRCLQERLPEYHCQPATGMHYGEQIKYVTWRFSQQEFKSIEVVHLTDTQFGHVCCNIKQLVKYRDWVLEVPNRFVFLGGDMIDAANIFSPGEPWENLFSPQRQLFKFCELLAPMRPRILGYCGGNHERRGIKTFGDLGVTIASLLRIPYSAGQQFINIQFGKHRADAPFQIFGWHGRGAARTVGAKAMMVYYAMRELSGGAHVTLVGHLHSALQLWATHRVHDRDKNRIMDRKITGAMSSSFLDYFGSYGEVGGMSPSDIIMARTVIESDGKWMLTVR